MSNNKLYLKGTLVALGALLILIGSVVGYTAWKKQKDILFEQEFKSGAIVAHFNGKTITSPCNKLQAKLILKENTVTLIINGDTLTGIPLGLREDNGLEVRFTENLSVILYKADPDGDGVAVLIIDGPGEALLLSSNTDCEDITTLLGQTGR